MNLKDKNRLKEIISKLAQGKIDEPDALRSLIKLMEKYADSRLAAYLDLDGSKKIP